MEKSFNQASVAAGAAFGAILIGAKKGLDTFNQYTSTMNGLYLVAWKKQKKSLEDYVDEINSLNSAYEKLSKGEELSADNLLELIQLYPNIAKHIAENANWRETLIGVIDKERESSKQTAIAELQNRKIMNEAVIKDLESRFTAYAHETEIHNLSISEKGKGH